MSTAPALVWLPADHRDIGEEGHRLPFHLLGDKYARAVRDGAACQPVLFPLAHGGAVDALLPLVDGVMLTGSPSNVEPGNFGQAVHDPDLPLDPQRDALTLELVRACVAQGVPLLGICRGFQEMNVALGGSLHQAVHEVPGLMDHRDPPGESLEVQYGLSHDLSLAHGSLLARLAGGTQARVNSLHGQGVDRLAPGLRVTARAPDGLVEAFEVEGASTFALAVQWHPEWRCMDNALYRSIFQAFGEACRARQELRRQGLAHEEKQA